MFDWQASWACWWTVSGRVYCARWRPACSICLERRRRKRREGRWRGSVRHSTPSSSEDVTSEPGPTLTIPTGSHWACLVTRWLCWRWAGSKHVIMLRSCDVYSFLLLWACGLMILWADVCLFLCVLFVVCCAALLARTMLKKTDFRISCDWPD